MFLWISRKNDGLIHSFKLGILTLLIYPQKCIILLSSFQEVLTSLFDDAKKQGQLSEHFSNIV